MRKAPVWQIVFITLFGAIALAVLIVALMVITFASRDKTSKAWGVVLYFNRYGEGRLEQALLAASVLGWGLGLYWLIHLLT